jgi:hypothetical protein
MYRIHPLILIVTALWAVGYPILPAQASFVATMFNESTFVIGADSRITGAGAKDDFCKIIPVGNQIVFAMIGYAYGHIYRQIGTVTFDIFDLHRKVDSRATTSEMARSFGTMATRELNQKVDPSVRYLFKTLPSYPLVAIGLFGGFDDSNAPSLSAVRIAHDAVSNEFFILKEEKFSEPGETEVIIFNYVNETWDILRGKEFDLIDNNRSLAAPDRLAAKVMMLIREMIRRNVSTEVGGVPTVLVIEKGKSPRWHTRTNACPRLD